MKTVSYFSAQLTTFQYYGDHILESVEGVQHGDPLVLVWFYTTIQSIVKEVKSHFCVFYMYDGAVDDRANDGGMLHTATTDL